MASEVAGRDVPHPGVGILREGGSVKYHKYYRWVSFFLFFQAMFFYFPRYLWKKWEAGRMKRLVLDLSNPIIAPETKEEQKELLIGYFTSNLRSHNSYAIRFFVCEVLNFINVIGQIFFVDYFLGGGFTTYGSDVIRMSQKKSDEGRIDPMSMVTFKIIIFILFFNTVKPGNFGQNGLFYGF